MKFASVTTDGFWIDDRIYRTLWYSAWLHFTVYCNTHTHTHQCLQSRLHCRCLVAASNWGRSPSSGFPNSPQQQLTTTEPQQFTHSPTNSSLTPLTDWLIDWLTDWLTIAQWVTLRLVAYHQSVRLGAKPLGDHDRGLIFNWTLAVIVLT
jgi:hypothetical protein